MAFVYEEHGTQTSFPDVYGNVTTKTEFGVPEKSATENTNDEKECEILPNVTKN